MHLNTVELSSPTKKARLLPIKKVIANLISKHLTIKRKPKLIFKEVSQSTIKRTND